MLITFREGLESFLIVAIILAYLTKTGRFNLIKPVYSGIAAALIVNATTGYHVQELAENPVWEGTLAFIAGGLVASLTWYVMKTARTIRQDIHNRIDKQATQDGVLAEIGIFFFTVLMISREGMETALMLGAVSAQQSASALLAGAALGIALAGLIGYCWIRQSNKINIRLFLQVTGIFLILFSAHLFLYGLHELSEMSALPLPDDLNVSFHNLTEAFEPGHLFGQFVTYSLLAAPCAWLAFSWLKGKIGSAGAAE